MHLDIFENEANKISNNWGKITLYSALIVLFVAIATNAYYYVNEHNRFETVGLKDVVSNNVATENLDIAGKTKIVVADQTIFNAKKLSQMNISVKDSNDGVHFYTATLSGTDPVDSVYYVYEKKYLPKPDNDLFFSDMITFKKSVDENSVKKTADGWEFDILYTKKGLSEALDVWTVVAFVIICLSVGAVAGFLAALGLLFVLAFIQVIVNTSGFVWKIITYRK